MPKHVFFKLFDTKVVPILVYGSDIWGFKRYDILEQVQNYACKSYMCVDVKSCNAAVLGDCGRFPLYIETAKRCLRFWIRILKKPNHRLVKKCYTSMMKYFNDLGNINWCTHIKQLLQSSGYGYSWEMQDIPNESTFILAFVQRLKDQYVQNWFTDVSLNRKLVLYKDFKLNCSHESYLDIIKIRTYRHALAQIRTGHHSLEIEKGRYINIPRNQRLCKVCSSYIEDEYHFVLCCNVYDDLRDMYLPKKYHSQPNLHTFNILMSTRSSDIIHSLAKYVYYAFKRRSTLVN